MLLIHRCDIVEAVEIGQSLQTSLVFDQFLGTAVKETNMRIDAPYYFAIQFQHKTQHPMGRGCCGSKLIMKMRGWSLGHFALHT